MKRTTLFGLITLTATALLGADSSSIDVVKNAAAKLAQQDNYSWKTLSEMGNFSATSQGKAQEDGLVELSMTFGENTTEAFLKDSKGAVKAGDQDWQSLTELAAGGGPGRRQFLARRLQEFKAPAAEAADLAGKTSDFKEENGVYAGDLTEAGAKQLLTFRRRGGNALEPKGAKGSVQFWVKDGLLSKYVLKLQGTINFNGEDRDIDRTTTVEIKDVGTTHIQVPEAAEKKLSGTGAAKKGS